MYRTNVLPETPLKCRYRKGPYRKAPQHKLCKIFRKVFWFGSCIKLIKNIPVNHITELFRAGLRDRRMN